MDPIASAAYGANASHFCAFAPSGMSGAQYAQASSHGLSGLCPSNHGGATKATPSTGCPSGPRSMGYAERTICNANATELRAITRMLPLQTEALWKLVPNNASTPKSVVAALIATHRRRSGSPIWEYNIARRLTAKTDDARAFKALLVDIQTAQIGASAERAAKDQSVALADLSPTLRADAEAVLEIAGRPGATTLKQSHLAKVVASKADRTRAESALRRVRTTKRGGRFEAFMQTMAKEHFSASLKVTAPEGARVVIFEAEPCTRHYGTSWINRYQDMDILKTFDVDASGEREINLAPAIARQKWTDWYSPDHRTGRPRNLREFGVAVIGTDADGAPKVLNVQQLPDFWSAEEKGRFELEA